MSVNDQKTKRLTWGAWILPVILGLAFSATAHASYRINTLDVLSYYDAGGDPVFNKRTFTIELPTTPPDDPSSGYPVVILLHGTGKSVYSWVTVEGSNRGDMRNFYDLALNNNFAVIALESGCIPNPEGQHWKQFRYWKPSNPSNDKPIKIKDIGSKSSDCAELPDVAKDSVDDYNNLTIEASLDDPGSEDMRFIRKVMMNLNRMEGILDQKNIHLAGFSAGGSFAMAVARWIPEGQGDGGSDYKVRSIIVQGYGYQLALPPHWPEQRWLTIPSNHPSVFITRGAWDPAAGMYTQARYVEQLRENGIHACRGIDWREIHSWSTKHNNWMRDLLKGEMQDCGLAPVRP